MDHPHLLPEALPLLDEELLQHAAHEVVEEHLLRA